MNNLLLKFFLLFGFCNYSQTTIDGKIHTIKNTLIENAYIIIYNDNTNKLLEYVNSDEKGNFKFQNKYSLGIYRIETSRIGFKKNIQKIAIGTEEDKSINIKIIMEESEGSILKEIVVTAQKPIIVKKDTIIYDISHFTKKHDESLEEVLSKIEGFKIKPNGDIEVNGKTIQKVLIDGKEVSDFGGAMITKSLSPEKVKSVEVRFDEKNKKLKESLLTDDKFVVLDIKLKEDFDKSLFGKQQLTTGFQDNIKIGGLSNFFSLGKRTNIQFFAENNNFGRNTIQLNQIKNIGEESRAKMFSLPVDIDDIKQRNGFNEEVYGFDNFIQNDNSIIGFSSNFVISKKTDIYIGSFNNYQYLLNSSSNQLYFKDILINDFKSISQICDYNSKNKIQIKHTSDKFKLTTDFNFVLQNSDNNNFVNNNFKNEYFKKSNFNNIYLNNFMEYEISSSFGLTSLFSYKNERLNYDFEYFTSNSLILNYLNLLENIKFIQKDINKNYQLNKSLFLTYKSEILGVNTLGVKYIKSSLDNFKNSESVNFKTLSPFIINAFQYSIFHKINQNFDKFSFSYSHEFTKFQFPFTENQENYKIKDYYQFDINLSYDFNNSSNINILYNSKLDYFPLNKVTQGNTLIDFQTVFIPNQNLNPFYNKTFSISYNKIFNNKNEIDIAFLQGESNNLNNQGFENNIITINANQLQSKYYVFSTIYNQKLLKKSLNIVYEPEFLINESQFILDNNIQKTTTFRYLLGIKSTYKLSEFVSIFFYAQIFTFYF
jgi:hypothetical protein